ncbi:hypothetical protein P3G55_02505 [Leptospira sp. 96542]|nr:hypothetical protein [Leptospira sp. 96542]
MMKTDLKFFDHKSKHYGKIQWITLSMNILVLFIIVPILWDVFMEMGSEGYLLFGFFIISFLSPFFVLKFLLKTKQFVFEGNSKKFYILENKKIISELLFHEIKSISYSEYNYIIKSKNGHRTITVYTVVTNGTPSPIILAESTKIFEVRQFGEKIAKFLQIPMKINDSITLEHTELDLPIHKRRFSEDQINTQPEFPKHSNIHFGIQNGEYIIESLFFPKIYLFVSIILGFAFCIFFHFFIGEILLLSIVNWENFPPTLGEIIFLILSLFVGFSPSFYVFWKLKQKRIIRIGSNFVQIFSKKISFEDLEEILITNHKILFINDKTCHTLSLYFFCDSNEYEELKNSIYFAIAKQADVSLEGDDRF